MRTVILVGFLLACGASGVIGALKCKEVKFDVGSGLCKGLSMNGKYCMGDDMTNEMAKSAMELLSEASCTGMEGPCKAYGGKLKADYCKENGGFCKTQTGSQCSADEDCTAMTTKKPCCSAVKSSASTICDDVDAKLVDLAVDRLKSSNQCKDTDCISGATSLRGGAMFASAASALIALMVATVY